jgi:hypothetical protein
MKHLLFLILVLTSALGIQAQQFAAAPDIAPARLEPAYIVCGTGYSPSDCQLASGFMRLALSDLRVNIPGWRWVVVPSAQWKQTALSFGVKPSVPAFSSLSVNATYVLSDLVIPTQRTDENLLSYTSRTGTSRLRWVLAHESGHIVCRTSDDKKAEAAAQRIQAGNREVCR